MDKYIDKINYLQLGKGKKDIVLLHGWGQNIEMMMPLAKLLENVAKITIIDFPGHGLTPEPLEELSVYDFSTILEKFLIKLNIKNPIIIGHSFGGRIGIIFASRNKTEKLILFGAPCIRKEKKLSLKVRILKFLKKIPVINKLENFAKKRIGSTDYRNASPIMREILVNTVNEDLTECAKKIKCPTLLIWGDMDKGAPIEDAKELETIIKDAGLIEYKGGTHYTYLEFKKEIANVIKTFI